MDKQTQTDLEASVAKLEKEGLEKDKEISRLNTHLAKDDSLWGSELGQKRHSSILPTRLLHTQETLKHMVSGEKTLKELTGSTKEVFDDTLEDLSHIIKKSGDSSHFQDGQDIKKEPANQYKMYIRYFLLMTQTRKTQNMGKELLCIFFGVEQSMIYDYIKLANKYDNELYTVTPHNMTKYISMIKSEEEFKEILPGRDGGEITIDGTLVKTIRPDDEDEQIDTLYSGNDKMPIIRTAMILNRQKHIIAISDSQEVSYRDLTGPIQGLPEFGKWTQRLTEGKRIPSDRRVRLNLDGGYVGIQNYLLGVNTTLHKTPKDKESTATKNTQNKEHTKRCIPAEKVFAHVKNWKCMPGRYDGTAKEFNVEFNGTCGMYNKQKMWHDGTYQYWKNKIKNRI